jgi:hypothetical protein
VVPPARADKRFVEEHERAHVVDEHGVRLDEQRHDQAAIALARAMEAHLRDEHGLAGPGRSLDRVHAM